jgi:hypothetical protein
MQRDRDMNNDNNLMLILLHLVTSISPFVLFVRGSQRRDHATTKRLARPRSCSSFRCIVFLLPPFLATGKRHRQEYRGSSFSLYFEASFVAAGCYLCALPRGGPAHSLANRQKLLHSPVCTRHIILLSAPDRLQIAHQK